MVSPTVTLSPIFAVPLGEARLAPCERLNRELEALFLARENDEHRNPMPSHIPQDEVFESRFNLFRWPETCLQELRTFMLDTVAQTLRPITAQVRASRSPPIAGLREELALFVMDPSPVRPSGIFVRRSELPASRAAVLMGRIVIFESRAGIFA